MTWTMNSFDGFSSTSGPQPILVKLGGAAIDRADEFPQLFDALCALHRATQRDGSGVALIHGGGAAVDRQLARLGFTTERRDGIRITPPEQIDDIVAILAGLVNKRLVGQIQRRNVPAVGLCLGDGYIAAARKASGYSFDPGCVGQIVDGDPRLAHMLLHAGFMPVLCSIGFDEQGRALNINADDAAGALAGGLGCRELILMTDVPGVLDAAGQVIEELTAETIEQHIASGEIRGGMIPKVRGALHAARACGAPVTITSWSDPQSLARLALGQPAGTRVIVDCPAARAGACFVATPWSDLL